MEWAVSVEIPRADEVPLVDVASYADATMICCYLAVLQATERS